RRHLLGQAGLKPDEADSGAVTLIERFGSAANPNIHLHCLVLGTALDGISMIVLTSAVVLPMIQKAGFDLVWFGIFIVLLVEIAEVTPPVGFNLFVLQNMTGKDSNTIARAALPFFACLVLCIGLITVFPAIVTWLPDRLMGVER
ncbi:MAG: TRAP transporter large permease subunit, partial [Microbacteriaceae bacterium]|nr:TRAP transporter large permease subunit [Burkholderiaceae bacterium]